MPGVCFCFLRLRQDQGNLLPETEVLLIFRDTLMAVLYLHSRVPPIAHRRVTVRLSSSGRCMCEIIASERKVRVFLGRRGRIILH